MRKILIWLFLLGAVCGCAGTAEQWQATDEPVLTRRFLTLRQIYPGMTRSEVQGVLGQEVIIGYEILDPQAGQYRPITQKNPFRSEQVQSSGKTYDVDYYFVGIKNADGKISDDELVPLVFAKDKLLGQGWDYLKTKVLVP